MRSVYLVVSICLLCIIPLAVHHANAVTPQLTFGSLGSGPGQLHLPRGIAVDDSGNVYVADNRNHRVEKFDSSGKYLSEFDKGGIPEGIAVDGSGNIIVVERANMTIEKFSPGGTLISSFGSAGSAPGQLGNAERLAIDSSGNIYVTDVNTIQKFGPDGKLLSQFFENDSQNCCMNAMGIAVDSSDNVYVADMDGHRIIKFGHSGMIISEFNVTFGAPRISSTPQDVALDHDGNIYVADTYNGRIVKLDPSGNPVSSLGISGVPAGLAIKDGKVYVTDLANNRVDVFLTSQFSGNYTKIVTPSTSQVEGPGKNSTALEEAIKFAEDSPQFQSLVHGYNYTYSSDFEESGPLPSGGIGLKDHGFAFELYSGPVRPGSAVKVVEVLEDPSLTKILNVTSYPAVYNGPAVASAPSNGTGSTQQVNNSQILRDQLDNTKTCCPTDSKALQEQNNLNNTLLLVGISLAVGGGIAAVFVYRFRRDRK